VRTTTLAVVAPPWWSLASRSEDDSSSPYVGLPKRSVKELVLVEDEEDLLIFFLLPTTLLEIWIPSVSVAYPEVGRFFLSFVSGSERTAGSEVGGGEALLEELRKDPLALVLPLSCLGDRIIRN